MRKSTHKVIHLTTVHYPYDTRILRRECITLSQNTYYKVSLFNGRGINDIFQGVRLVSFDDKKRGRVGRMLIRGWLAFISTKREKPDICHIHDPEIIWIGGLLQLYGTKVIYDAHEDYSQKIKARQWLPKPLRYISSHLYGILSRFFAKRFDGVISATDSISAAHPSKHNCTLHNYPRFNELDPGPRELRRTPKQILYTGGLTAHRGIEQVLQALCENCPTDWHLVIVGKSNPSVEKRVEDYLNDSRVEYRGIVSFDEVKTLLSKSEIGVVCNQPGFDYENALPNKLFEYMAAGLTVVCSNFKAWQAIVEKTGSGYTCDTSNPKALGSLFNYLLDHRELFKECGLNGKQAIQNHYSWEAESEKLLSFYKGILDEH